MAFARQADLIALIDSSRHLDLQGLTLLHSPFAMAIATRRSNHGAATTAVRTGLLDREKALLHAHLPLSAAGRAGVGRGARPCTGTAAGITTYLRGYLDP